MGQCTSSQYQLNDSAAAHIRTTTTSSSKCDIPRAKINDFLPLTAPIDDDSTITHQTPTDESNRRGSRRVSFSVFSPRLSARKGTEEELDEDDDHYARVPSVVLVPPQRQSQSLRTRTSQSLKR